MKEYQLVDREIICYAELRVYTIIDLAGWKMDRFIPVRLRLPDADLVVKTFTINSKGYTWDFV